MQRNAGAAPCVRCSRALDPRRQLSPHGRSAAAYDHQSGEPALNRHTVLHATSDLSVTRVDHPPHEAHHDPEQEVEGRWAIAFVRAGTFDVVVDGARHRMREGSVFITRPGLAFRCGHEGQYPDDICLSVGFEPGAVTGVEHAWARAGWTARRAPTPRLACVQHRLAGAADTSWHLDRMV